MRTHQPSGAEVMFRWHTPALILCLSVVPSTVWAWEIDEKAGQYYCYVEHVAGIRLTTDRPPASGAITLPESKKKFFIKVEPYLPSEIMRPICTNTFDYYKEYLEKGIAWPDSRYVGKRETYRGPRIYWLKLLYFGETYRHVSRFLRRNEIQGIWPLS
jgi:hypothetical protein